MLIRLYSSSDLKQIIKLFRETVTEVNAADYTEEQCKAWVSAADDPDGWGRSLAANYTVVALEDGGIIGFGDIDSLGYLNRLYIHKDHQRKGAATLIVGALEEHAFTSRGLDMVYTQASITARPFFLRRGYGIKSENRTARQGRILLNYSMEKRSANLKDLTVSGDE